MENEESEGFKRPVKMILFFICIAVSLSSMIFLGIYGWKFLSSRKKTKIEQSNLDNKQEKPKAHVTQNTRAEYKAKKGKEEELKTVRLNTVVKYNSDGSVFNIKIFDIEDKIFKDLSDYKRKIRIFYDDRKNPTILAEIPVDVIAKYESAYPRFLDACEKIIDNVSRNESEPAEP